MSKPPIACAKHRHNPVKGYSPCAGCEVERLTRERDAALAELAALKGGQDELQAQKELMEQALSDLWSVRIDKIKSHCMDAAPPAQASAWVQDSDIRSAAARAYGFLWHVNNEPGTPSPMYSAEKAAYRARIALRDMLTTEERGKAINAVGIEIGRYEQPAAPTPGASDGKGGDV